MFRLWLAFALMLGVSSCSWFQDGEEELEVSSEEDIGNNVAAGNNMGNQELGLGQQEGMMNENTTFDNQGIGENSSVAEGNPLLNNEGGMDMPAEGGDMAADGGMAAEGGDMAADGGMPAGDFSGAGGVVRYTMGETNVYAQPDASSAPVRTLGQGEVLLVTINGEFAQSSFGFIAVSDLSAELQPRMFSGNDWQ